MVTATRNTEALRARRGAALRERLLAVVERLYESGEAYSECSVERLIGEAGITRATFYSYFESKDHLLSELASGVLDEMLPFWIRLPPGSSKLELRAAIAEICRAYIPHRAVLVAIDDPAPDSAAADRFAAIMARCAAAVAVTIEQGQRDGAVTADIDAGTMAELLMWMTQRGLNKLVAPADPEGVTVLVDALTEIFWRTLRSGRA